MGGTRHQGLGSKTIDYQYDPITGQTRKVYYQKELPSECFIHSYECNTVDQLTSVATSLGGSTPLKMHAQCTYYETGALKRTELDGGRVQGIEYMYNLAGQWKAINPSGERTDLFGMQIDYHSSDYKRAVNNIHRATYGTEQYNGNIKDMRWQNKGATDQEAVYTYKYDPLNRIIAATDNTLRFGLSNVKYDKNGNITHLTRGGHLKEMPDWDKDDDFGTMDQLDYQYFDGSNRLRSVTDGILKNDTSGKGEFVDGNKDGDDYVYDPNGNMTQDLNKGIKGTTSTEKGIEYNHLNLPTLVRVHNGADVGTITYIYDATGVKLRKNVLKQGETTPTATDYAGNYIYENNTLQFFSTPEGYVQPKNPDNLSQGYDYIYQYKDHLGNVRLSYKDNNGTIEILSENYFPFGLQHKGYNGNVSSLGNSAAQKYMFGGQEYDESLGLEAYDFGSRHYMSDLGRWGNLDPLAELMRNQSPYNFGFNNPIYFSDYAGTIPWPVPEMFRNWIRSLGSPFGPRTRNGRTRNHDGVDINFSGGYNTDYGAPVVATHSGTVVRIHTSNEGAAGRYIEIESPDGSFMTRYLHLSSVAVAENQEISEGQTIGLLGGSGSGFNKKIKGRKGGYWAHLHYEIHRNGTPVNPVGSDGALIDPQSWIPPMGPFINAEAYNFGSSWSIFDVPFESPDQEEQGNDSGTSGEQGRGSQSKVPTPAPAPIVPIDPQPITPGPGPGPVPINPGPRPQPDLPPPNCIDC